MKYSLVLLAFLSVAPVFADQLVLKDGTIYKGVIVGATQDSVSIMLPEGVVLVGKSNVLTLVFSHADVLYLRGDQRLRCKVVSKVEEEVVVVTSEGVRNIPNKDISRVLYNGGDEIQVNGLPETGRQFVNDPAPGVWIGESKSNFFVRLHLASHYPSLKQWRNQFVITQGGSSPENGLVFGGGLGYAFNNWLQLGGGYEYYMSQTVKITNTTPGIEDEVTSTFIYGTARIGAFLASMPQLFLFGGGDIGVLRGTETLKYSDGVSVEGKGSKIGVRLRAGGEYYFSGNWSTLAEVGYLLGNVDAITVNGVNVANYGLDFSGLSLIVGFGFHIPTH